MDGLLGGLVAGLLYGLLGGLIDFWRFQRTSPVFEWRGRYKILQMILGTVSWGLIDGLIFALTFGLVDWLIGPTDRLIDWLAFKLLGLLPPGLIGGMIFGLFWMIRSTWRPLSQAIQSVEVLQWSWRSSFGAGFRGLGVGSAAGLVLMLIVWLNIFRISSVVDMPNVGLTTMLFIGGPLVGLLVSLIAGMLGGFRPGIRGIKTVPNQGIKISLHYAVRMGAAVGSIMGLLLGLLAQDPGIGLACGLIASLCLGLWFGGLEVVEHGILRLILALRGHAPRNYVRFLDDAAQELKFLQKVGGGYIFIHRYLLEYFAGLEDRGKRDLKRSQSSPRVTTPAGRD